MSGGPLTETCINAGYIFNRKGERLFHYSFDRWGYNVLHASVTYSEAQLLDTDPTFRARFIKAHGYEKYKETPESAYEPPDIPSSDSDCADDAAFLKSIGGSRDIGKPQTEALILANKSDGTDEKHQMMRFLINYAYLNKLSSPEELAASYIKLCLQRPGGEAQSTGH